MRQIKFRGLRTDGGGWVYGYYFGGYNWADFIIEDAGFEHRVRVIPETVGQFTVLNDKNGKEIYSDDYVRWFGASGVEDGIGVVKWCNDKSAYVVYVDDYNEYCLYDVHYADLEVIGNTHEEGVCE